MQRAAELPLRGKTAEIPVFGGAGIGAYVYVAYALRCVDGAAFHSGHARERGAATFGPPAASPDSTAATAPEPVLPGLPAAIIYGTEYVPSCLLSDDEVARRFAFDAPSYSPLITSWRSGAVWAEGGSASLPGMAGVESGTINATQRAVGRRGRNIGSLRRGVCCHGDEQGEYEFSHVAKIQKFFDKELIVVRRIHVFAIICLPVSYPRLSCGLFILSPTVCRKPSARPRQLPLLIFVQRPPSLARKCGAHSAVIRI